MDGFDEQFGKMTRRAGAVGCISVLFSTAISLVLLGCVIYLLFNPELIGQYFSQIAQGFDKG